MIRFARLGRGRWPLGYSFSQVTQWGPAYLGEVYIFPCYFYNDYSIYFCLTRSWDWVSVNSHAVLGPRSDSFLICVGGKLAPVVPIFLLPIMSKVTYIGLSFPSSLDKLLVLSVPARVSAACLSSGRNMACMRLNKALILKGPWRHCQRFGKSHYWEQDYLRGSVGGMVHHWSPVCKKHVYDHPLVLPIDVALLILFIRDISINFPHRPKHGRTCKKRGEQEQETLNKQMGSSTICGNIIQDSTRWWNAVK
jgi:hypothetical protein